MVRNYYSINQLLAVLAFCLFATEAPAQLFMRRKAKKKHFPPSCVFVQLGTGQTRVNYLLRQGKHAEAKKVQRAWADANKNLVLDFKENFTYCRFYFFYDTLRKYVVKKDFENRLLDKNLRPVTSPVIAVEDTSYFILDYSFPDDHEEIKWKTIIASNWKGQELKYPLPYKSFPGYNPDPKYYYYSRRTDVEYKGYAQAYNATLREFYRKKKKPLSN